MVCSSLIANTLTVRSTGIDIDCTAAGVHRPRSGDRPGRRAIDGIAPVSRRRADRDARRGRRPGREPRPVRNVSQCSGARPPPGRPRAPAVLPTDAPSPGCPPVPDSFGGSRCEGRPGRAPVAPARPRAGRAAFTRLRLSSRGLGDTERSHRPWMRREHGGRATRHAGRGTHGTGSGGSPASSGSATGPVPRPRRRRPVPAAPGRREHNRPATHGE